jgi:hypothetical protein
VTNLFYGSKKLSRQAQYKLRYGQSSFRQLRPGLTLLTFIILSGLVGGAFQAANLVSSGQQLTGRVLGTADEGLAYISEAQQYFDKQDASGASERFGLALQSFEKSRQELNSNNLALQGLMNLIPQKQDADSLLEATILLTKAGQDWMRFYELSKTTKITPQGIIGQQAGDVMREMNNHLQEGRQKTDQAVTALRQVNPGSLPSSKRDTFVAIQGSLAAIQTAVNSVSDVFDVLYTISAGEKNVLLLFQNYNELRATGGFMGTYGAMKLADGQIRSLKVSSIYDLDGQLKESLTPPYQFLPIAKQWYLRDTNWFTHFPHSAQVISRYYEKEGGETPDLIVLLTPQVVIDWLKITGPITLSRYNATFTAENFLELIQLEGSVYYDKFLNQPKQVIADFFPALLQRLSELPSDQMLPLIASLHKNLTGKHILLHSRNAQLQERLEKFNWTGSLKQTDRDYLLVSSSNLGGTKTDVYMKQDITLGSVIQDNDRIVNTVTITRSNPLSDQPAMRNLSFLRVYVPQGAKLISASGFTSLTIPRSLEPNQQVDPDVRTWEENSVTDTISGTLIGLEDGKTIFGNWLEVKGGQTKTVKLTYELPFSLNSLDHHSLLLQKQPGSLNQTFSYSLRFNNQVIAWKNFQPQKLESHNLQLNEPLDKDRFYGLILQQP